jgi:NCS1 family nucleobase:cation symporter-1
MGTASFWKDHVVLKPRPGALQADEKGSYMYSNEDMDPIKRKDRTYEWYQMGLFWIAEGFNGAQLQVASSAFALGLNPGLCVVACLVGNIIVSLPCAASGYLGSKLGTNFPGTVRASFGILGAKWAMIVRGIPCIIYYGIQTSLAGQAVHACISAIWPSFNDWKVDAIPKSADITAQDILCFSIFWLISLPFLYLRISTLRHLFVLKSILVPLYWTAMFTWSVTAAGGYPDIWRKPSMPLDGKSVGYLFGICVNAAISPNATFAVNIMDISRYSKNDRAAWMTQLFAIPVFVTMTEFLGCTMAVASSVVYGKVEWNPLVVINQFDYRAGKFFAGALFVFFNIMTNVTGNSIPLANDLTGLFPKYINIRRGQFICAVIAFATCPWKIQAQASTFLAFLGAYTLFLGATTGIMMVDYYLIRRGYGINIAHLFKARGSIYWYTYGVNWRAFVAWFVALAPLLPGMLNSMGVTITNQSILNMYSWNYVLVVAFSGSIYWALGAIWPFPVHSDGAYDTGALYLIEGLEPEGLMTSDLVEKGEKRGTPESEKTTLQSSALPHVLDSREKKS